MKFSFSRKILAQALFVVVFIALALWLGTLVEDSEAVQEIVRSFGYIGVLVVAAVSGFNLLVPVPAIALLPVFTASGLDPVITVGVIALGMTIGDAVGFFIGRVARKIAEHYTLPDWLGRFERWLTAHRGGVPVFMFLFSSFVPLPNEIVVIPAAATGQKWQYVLIPLFFGHIVFNSLLALGITGLFEIL